LFASLFACLLDCVFVFVCYCYHLIGEIKIYINRANGKVLRNLKNCS